LQTTDLFVFVPPRPAMTAWPMNCFWLLICPETTILMYLLLKSSKLKPVKQKSWSHLQWINVECKNLIAYNGKSYDKKDSTFTLLVTTCGVERHA